jgi:gas vesicle protein
MLESSDYTITEKEEIVKRLKICRKEQGNQIDKAKGLFIKPFPVSWTRRIKRGIDESEEEKEKNDANDRLIISKRPYFMRWLYNNYNKDYKKYKNAKNIYCIGVFGYSLEDFLFKSKETLDEKELWFYNIYLKNNPLLDSSCVINKICHYMEKSISLIKENRQLEDDENLINLIKDDAMQVENLHEKLNKMLFLYEKYKKHKQSLTIADDGSEEHFRTVEQYNKSIRQEAYSISSNIAELANIAIAICYVRNRDRGFVWNLFGEGIVENVIKGKQEKITVPFINKDGDIEYLGNQYSLFEINIKKGEDVYTM